MYHYTGGGKRNEWPQFWRTWNHSYTGKCKKVKKLLKGAILSIIGIRDIINVSIGRAFTILSNEVICFPYKNSTFSETLHKRQLNKFRWMHFLR
jgi:hypothetical protein